MTWVPPHANSREACFQEALTNWFVLGQHCPCFLLMDLHGPMNGCANVPCSSVAYGEFTLGWLYIDMATDGDGRVVGYNQALFLDGMTHGGELWWIQKCFDVNTLKQEKETTCFICTFEPCGTQVLLSSCFWCGAAWFCGGILRVAAGCMCEHLHKETLFHSLVSFCSVLLSGSLKCTKVYVGIASMKSARLPLVWLGLSNHGNWHCTGFVCIGGHCF